MNQSDEHKTMTETPKQIKWAIPDSIRTDHATHIVLQQQGSEFVWLFFELQGPVLMGTLEEQLREYHKLASIEARCVAKIVMSVENITLAAKDFLEVLSRFQITTPKREG